MVGKRLSTKQDRALMASRANQGRCLGSLHDNSDNLWSRQAATFVQVLNLPIVYNDIFEEA